MLPKTRRQVLRSASLLGALWPVENLLSGLFVRGDRDLFPTAAAASPKLRVVYCSSFFGHYKPDYQSQETANGLNLGLMLKALEPHKRDLLLTSGFSHRAASEHAATQCIFTGYNMEDDEPKGSARLAGRPIMSLDQAFAAKNASATILPTLAVGIRTAMEGGEAGGFFHSYRGFKNPVVPINDPLELLGKFQNAPDVNQISAQRRRALDLSLLDGHAQDLAALVGKLPKEMGLRVDEHLSAVRDLERRSSNVPACAFVPEPPLLRSNKTYLEAGNESESPHFIYTPDVAAAQVDVIAAALACDVTRTVVFQFGHEATDMAFPWLVKRGLPLFRAHDGVQHEGSRKCWVPDGPITWIQGFFIEKIANLVTQLKEKKDPDGSSVFDSTMIVLANSMGADGNVHGSNEIPYIVISGKNWNIPKGRWIETNNRPSNDMVATLAKIMGVDDKPYTASPFFGSHVAELLG